MVTPNEKLAQSLEMLHGLGPMRAIPARALARVHRERLLEAGFLSLVVNGWYVQSRPSGEPGDSTAWFTSMRDFIGGYCSERFGDQWHISPLQSLLLHTGERSLPRQVQVWATDASNQSILLPHGTSLFLYKAPRLLPASPDAEAGGQRLVVLDSALIHAGPTLFKQEPLAAMIALKSLTDLSGLVRTVISGSHSVVAGRLAGALRKVGRVEMADELLATMRAAGFTVTETDPFSESPTQAFDDRVESPYVQRLRMLWAEFRQPVIDALPAPGVVPSDIQRVLADVQARYVADAYHSLSIEGYQVTPGLIEKVRLGVWDPDGEDRTARDAMAARGYFEAHLEVKAAVEKILNGSDTGLTLRREHGAWYRALFAPSVQLGILRAQDLAGYRDSQVYIRGALHVPLSCEAVRQTMPVLFDLIASEPHPGARALLGHFFFVYIHPYMDGNGRLARFLMNCILVTGGYCWTVIPVESRDAYMTALEEASTHQNIVPFARWLSGLIGEQQLHPMDPPVDIKPMLVGEKPKPT